MKKLFFILGLITLLFACSDDDDNTPQHPIQNLKLPAEETTFLSGQSVTIEGKGFTTESQIWLRAAGTKATGDVQAKVTAVNESSITFEVPEGVEGQQSVILKQNGEEYDLGKLTFKKPEEQILYAYRRSNSGKQIVKIDLLTGKENIVLNVNFDGDILTSPVFIKSSNEIVGLNDNHLIKIDLTNLKTTTINLSSQNKGEYGELIINKNDLYASQNYSKKIVKIDFITGKEEIVANVNMENNTIISPIFMRSTQEIIGIDEQNLIKINIENGTTKVINISSESNTEYGELIVDNNNNLYITQNYDNKIFKIDFTTGRKELICKINIEGSILTSPVYINATQEIIGINGNTLVKINIKNKTTQTISLESGYIYEELITG